MTFTRQHGDYTISDDPDRQDLAVIHGFITAAYWAAGRSRELVERAVRRSLCLGAYDAAGAQVAFARVVTDTVAVAHICDVFVLPTVRGVGLGKALVGALIDHPDLSEVRRLTLNTDDAHGLYAQFGFAPLAHPEWAMERIVKQ
jgi:GNAT superfamily N-acetyltransferase